MWIWLFWRRFQECKDLEEAFAQRLSSKIRVNGGSWKHPARFHNSFGSLHDQRYQQCLELIRHPVRQQHHDAVDAVDSRLKCHNYFPLFWLWCISQCLAPARTYRFGTPGSMTALQVHVFGAAFGTLCPVSCQYFWSWTSDSERRWEFHPISIATNTLSSCNCFCNDIRGIEKNAGTTNFPEADAVKNSGVFLNQLMAFAAVSGSVVTAVMQTVAWPDPAKGQIWFV